VPPVAEAVIASLGQVDIILILLLQGTGVPPIFIVTTGVCAKPITFRIVKAVARR